MDRQITISIPTFERVEWTLRAFEQVLYDDRVKEIVISDDFSCPETYKQLEYATAGMDKVFLLGNEKNIGCYFNKKRAIGLSRTPWVIILDSDNIISTQYLDKIFEQKWKPKTILAPDRGLPALDYTAFSGLTITKENVASYLDQGNFQSLLNTFNFFINRDRYLETFDDSVDPWTSDSIYFCYCWLKNGGKIKVVEGLSYHHEIHKDSHYVTNCHKAPGFYQELLKKIKELK